MRFKEPEKGENMMLGSERSQKIINFNILQISIDVIQYRL